MRLQAALWSVAKRASDLGVLLVDYSKLGSAHSIQQKFRHYLLGSHFKMFTDHSALKYLVNKPVLGGRICKWLILFQEYDFEIIVKPGRLNLGPDHLSRLESG